MKRTLLASGLTLLLAPTAHALQFSSAHALYYSIDQDSGLDTFGDKSTGQSFTPGIGLTPLLGVTKLALTEIKFFHGNYPASAPSITTFLNIYDGNPTSGGVFLGSSSNSIDTTGGLGFHSPMVWTFASLGLDYTTEYFAVMSSSSAAGGLNVAVSLETHDRNISPSLYGGGAGLIANIAPHPSSVDAKFNIRLETDSSGPLQAPPVWLDEGQALPGHNGPPTLTGEGTLLPQSPLTLELSNALPKSTTFLVVGVSSAPTPFFGGTLVPTPDLVLPLPTTSSGTASLTTTWPNTPPGLELHLQHWILDPAAPQGLAASNALKATPQ